MEDCADEKQTQHHLGAAHGFGPVMSEETVAFAVSAKTPTDKNCLLMTSFETKQLKRKEQSVARVKYTTADDFNSFVVQPIEKGDKFEGVATALVADIRLIPYGRQASDKCRGICVIDRVDQGMHDGHAALCFGDKEPADLPETTKARERKLADFRREVMSDLAEKFGPISTINAVRWAS